MWTKRSEIVFASVGTLKLSQTSPDVPNSEGGAQKDLPNAHSQQQVTPRSVSLCEGLLINSDQLNDKSWDDGKKKKNYLCLQSAKNLIKTRCVISVLRYILIRSKKLHRGKHALSFILSFFQNVKQAEYRFTQPTHKSVSLRLTRAWYSSLRYAASLNRCFTDSFKCKCTIFQTNVFTKLTSLN